MSRFSKLVQDWKELQPTPVTKKPKKKKKKKKKEMKEQEKEKTRSAAATAAETEKQRNVMIKEMQEEIRLEKYNSERHLQLEIEQGAKRRIHLEKTCRVIHNNEKTYMDYVLKTTEEEEWLRYMTCDGLPDPGVLSQLNTFLFLWDQEYDEASMLNVTTKCQVVTYLLAKLDNIIDFSVMAAREYIDECKEIRRMFRERLKCWIDLASYRLLRHIEWDMVREDLKNARYVKESSELICCVWALIQLPISIKQVAERDRKSIEVIFNELDITLKMPVDMDCYAMAIRGLWVQYDHYSDLSPSFLMPEIPREYHANEDLLTFTSNEYETKMKIREEQVEGRKLRLEEKKALVERLLNPPQAVKEKKGKGGKKQAAVVGRTKKSEPEAEPEPLPYLPTPDEIVLQKEEENRKEVRKLLFTRCEKTEINLRKYAILGGVLNIDLIYQPPQPKDMRRDIFLTTLQLPKELKFVPFSRPYKAPPPAPDAERTPEIIEAEIKALEAAMEKLVLITLQLPDSVLWLEPPLVAHWIPERRIWSTQDVHDIKYNEEKQIITFRSGRLGVHGLAAFKFVNLPFQSWELKPETGKAGGVVLTISAAIVQVEFIVKEDLVCLHSLAGGGTAALQDLVGKYMRLDHLIRKMRAGGCDLFPDRDAISYVKGLPVKHPVTERHLQACMGLLCTAYMFAWSRWNAAGTARQIVMQIKELHGCIAKERSNMMLLVTPLQTMLIQCTEVGSEFCDKPLDEDNNKFFADVYHLALHTAGIKSRLLMKAVSCKLATTVTKLLEATNVISMST
ncbi:axonemal 84 kDa protein [Diachasma alloeum]|uniref:axonemal 84 kDa protein n=1 Tax=Diachasma alloeum TaxID=454923 RepID=UPI0007383D9B|nr:axonemal 84 kDa protein [Diachasma alloeum]